MVDSEGFNTRRITSHGDEWEPLGVPSVQRVGGRWVQWTDGRCTQRPQGSDQLCPHRPRALPPGGERLCQNGGREGYISSVCMMSRHLWGAFRERFIGIINSLAGFI